jgi:uncharacterized lipoprotein YajG
MKNLTAKLAWGLLGVALLAGCASSDTEKTPVTEPTRVTLLFSKPAKSYVAVGTVSTLKIQQNPGETWQNVLQKQAAARGADAVLIDTSTLNNINTPMVTGTAIHYQ